MDNPEGAGFLWWLQESGFGVWVAESTWAYPIILTLHTVGLALLVGTTAFVDLRVLGVGSGVPIGPLRTLSPVRWLGLSVNVLSGAALFVAAAAEKGAQTIFYVKLSLIALALLTDGRLRHLIFPGPIGDRAGRSATGPALIAGDPPITVEARGFAAASLLLWAGAIAAGRLMAYV